MMSDEEEWRGGETQRIRVGRWLVEMEPVLLLGADRPV